MRGYTLVELLIASAMIGVVVSVAGGVGASLHGADKHTDAYVADLDGLRRAVRTIERDIHAGRGLADYRLEDGVLLRGGRVLARNIATFERERDGELVTVRLGPGLRREVAAPVRPVLVVKARAR